MDGVQSLKILQQLMVAAFQTDSTRVITYRQPVDSLLKSWGINIGSHPLSHQNMSKARLQMSQLKDFKSMELFAGLIDLFKKTQDVNGKSLFDSTLISALKSITRPNVILADITTLWEKLLTRKNFADLSGNNVNHPNDFGHRLYTEVLFTIFGKT